MYANETQARAYLTEVTGLTLGRVVANFPHRIEFQCAALSPSDTAELTERVRARFPEMYTAMAGLENRCFIDHGKVVFFKEHSVGVAQVCEPSENLQSAMRSTWQAIYEEGLDVRSNVEAVELVLDADRIEMLGDNGVKAGKEVDALQALFGYDKMEKALSAKVRLL